MDRGSLRYIKLAIVSAALLVYLIGNDAVQLWDRDEPRYAQTSRQMLQSGDWVVPRFLDTIRTAKPAGIYWCQAACMSVLGDNAFAARLPSVIGVTLTVILLMAFFGRRLENEGGKGRGVWTAFVFATAGLSILSAKMSTVDGVLVLFVTAAQLCVFTLLTGRRRVGPAILLGLLLGAAGLLKGPVVLGILGMTLIAWRLVGCGLPHHDRSPAIDGAVNRTLRRREIWIVTAIATIVMLVVAAPWLYLIQQRAPEFLRTAIGHDVIDRVRTGLEGHSGPPGFYLLTIWGTFFPWSLLLPAALVHGWRRRHLPMTRFALAATAGPWVMFELIATKLPHYLLPTFPFLAYLVGDLIASAARVADLRGRGFRIAVRVWAVVVVAIGFAGATGLVLSRERLGVVYLGAGLAAVVAIGMAWRAARSLLNGRFESGAAAMGGGMLALVAVFYALYLPTFSPLRISANVADLIKENGGYGARGYMIDYKEPSLAFHAGGGLREQRDEDYLKHSDPADWPEWLIVTDRVLQRADEDVLKRWTVVGGANGLSYNERGRNKIWVLRNVAPPAKSARIDVFEP